MKDIIASWLANLLPERIVYYAAIRLIGYATLGRYGSSYDLSLGAMEAVQIWQEKMEKMDHKAARDHKAAEE